MAERFLGGLWSRAYTKLQGRPGMKGDPEDLRLIRVSVSYHNEGQHEETSKHTGHNKVLHIKEEHIIINRNSLNAPPVFNLQLQHRNGTSVWLLYTSRTAADPLPPPCLGAAPGLRTCESARHQGLEPVGQKLDISRWHNNQIHQKQL